MGHLVYDADCGFCTRSAHWLDDAPVAWHTLDLTAVGATRDQADQNAGWLVDGRITALGAPAIVRALRAKRGPARVAGWLLTVPGLRHAAALVYPRIAANRHRMPGGTAACRITPPEEHR
ncbi:putative DCC family thiol-disulfide oxidoreductase YuxK [Marmoricola sp. OAE513]|uniref:thiol-disulfide oxidoreductase DCC family protein n=1 Tax=Marmoricola sp. OAE513 TaxID=2817894 RepID=UPI001AE1F106